MKHESHYGHPKHLDISDIRKYSSLHETMPGKYALYLFSKQPKPAKLTIIRDFFNLTSILHSSIPWTTELLKNVFVEVTELGNKILASGSIPKLHAAEASVKVLEGSFSSKLHSAHLKS